jgi:hypothetical protein
MGHNGCREPFGEQEQNRIDNRWNQNIEPIQRVCGQMTDRKKQD